jgi:negative regulator of replication initiation
MKTIRISDAVHDYIAAHGKFGENHDAVLTRLFKLSQSDIPRAEPTPIPSIAPTGRTRIEHSTREMKARVNGRTLSIAFEHEAPRTWTLPERKDDKSEIRRVRDLAVEYAIDCGATDGQRNAVGKAISEAGYYLTRPRATQ